MNVSPIVEKTQILKTANNVDIQVDDLPRAIRFEVETLDRLNQTRMDGICHIEMLELAIHSQKLKIGELIKNIVTPSPEPEATNHD